MSISHWGFFPGWYGTTTRSTGGSVRTAITNGVNASLHMAEWKTVPTEPTAAMIAAYKTALKEYIERGPDGYKSKRKRGGTRLKSDLDAVKEAYDRERHRANQSALTPAT